MLEEALEHLVHDTELLTGHRHDGEPGELVVPELVVVDLRRTGRGVRYEQGPAQRLRSGAVSDLVEGHEQPT